MVDRLPLFPLGQPLFPGIRLDLQIFEQRYLRLVRKSMREDVAFGIVATEDGRELGAPLEIYDFGLAVKIVDWERLENGLLGIVVCGERRFNIQKTEVEDDGLIIAEVEWLPEFQETADYPDENLQGLEGLLRDLAQHPALNWVGLPEQISASELGWRLAQVLPVSTTKKVRLLAEPSSMQCLAKIQILVDELSSI